MTDPEFLCPRCRKDLIPDDMHPGQYPGALSRADNKTEVCTRCGFDEAMIEFEYSMEHYGRPGVIYRSEPQQVVPPPDQWPVERRFEQLKFEERA